MRGVRLRLAGLLLISFNLRPALASVSPLLDVIRADLHLGYAGLSLLTVLPVLCMGVFPFAAAHLAGRVGAERGVLGAVVLLVLATALRLAGGDAPLLFGTALLAGIGIAAAQTSFRS